MSWELGDGLLLDQAREEWDLDQSLHFLTEPVGPEDFEAAILTMPDSYNEFEMEFLFELTSGLKPEAIQVGREGSPVAYFHFTSADEAAKAERRVRRYFRRGDEVNAHDTVLRIWWD